MYQKHWFTLNLFCWLSVSLLVLAGCVVIPIRGFYDGSEAPGWIRSTVSGDGGTLFYDPSAGKFENVQIIFSTSEPGLLYFHLTLDHGKPAFAGKKITIVFNDTKGLVEFLASDEISFQVGTSRDFTVKIPAFRIQDKAFPELTAHFHWNEKTELFIQK